MIQITNSKQAEGLARFFFDIGKGALLGAGGLSTGIFEIPPATRMVYLVGGLAIAYGCVREALSLLERL